MREGAPGTLWVMGRRPLALPAFQKLKPYEEVILGTPVAERRARLQGIGAPLAATTVGTATPRRGIMPICAYLETGSS